MVVRNMSLCIGIVLIASCAVALLDAQDKPGGIIKGQIVAGEGEPLVGANVVVEGTLLGATSDVNGKFVIVGVPPGLHKLKATYIGYSPVMSQSIWVREGETAEVTVVLPGEVVIPDRPREQRPPPREPEDYPKFPWPPPKSSAHSLISAEKLRAKKPLSVLADLARTLEGAMDSCGYAERRYYWVPRGFGLVSRIEQLKSDGSPKEGADRWSVNITPPKIFSIESLIKAFFTANAGRFRIVVFIVTSQSFAESDSTVEKEEAIQWLHRGMQSLPESIGNLPYTASHTCTAFIYEFIQATPNHTPQFMDPSNITGRMHLEKSRLWEVLGQ